MARVRNIKPEEIPADLAAIYREFAGGIMLCGFFNKFNDALQIEEEA